MKPQIKSEESGAVPVALQCLVRPAEWKWGGIKLGNYGRAWLEESHRICENFDCNERANIIAEDDTAYYYTCEHCVKLLPKGRVHTRVDYWSNDSAHSRRTETSTEKQATTA